MKRLHHITLSLSAALSVLPALSAQVTVPADATKSRLRIGDPAPAFQVKWIKGAPISKLEPEKTYVVEFWATWCNPCREAMPHLSEIARKKAGKVEVIGVGIWEKVPSGKPYESCHPKVEAFVKSMGNDMDYHVALDVNGQPMVKAWMTAAGEAGIPASFVVKGGKIVWKGHPHELDKVLADLEAGTYDMAAFAEQTRQKELAAEKRDDPFGKLVKSLTPKIEAKDYDAALAAIGEAEKTFPPEHRQYLNPLRLNILLKADPTKAMAYARSLGPDMKKFEVAFALQIIEEDGLPAEAYVFAAEVFQKLTEKPNERISLVNHALATALAKKGDFAGAVKAETLAVTQAKEAMAKGTVKGLINQSIINEYQSCLTTYKSKATAEVVTK